MLGHPPGWVPGSSNQGKHPHLCIYKPIGIREQPQVFFGQQRSPRILTTYVRHGMNLQVYQL